MCSRLACCIYSSLEAHNNKWKCYRLSHLTRWTVEKIWIALNMAPFENILALKELASKKRSAAREQTSSKIPKEISWTGNCNLIWNMGQILGKELISSRRWTLTHLLTHSQYSSLLNFLNDFVKRQSSGFEIKKKKGGL